MTGRPEPGPATPDWDTTLDELELSLLAWERWLDDTSQDPPEQWTPRAGHSAPTAEQGQRALVLHERYQATSRLTRARLEAVQRQRNDVSGPRPTHGGYGDRPAAAYLDLEA